MHEDTLICTYLLYEIEEEEDAFSFSYETENWGHTTSIHIGEAVDYEDEDLVWALIDVDDPIMSKVIFTSLELG